MAEDGVGRDEFGIGGQAELLAELDGPGAGEVVGVVEAEQVVRGGGRRVVVGVFVGEAEGLRKSVGVSDIGGVSEAEVSSDAAEPAGVGREDGAAELCGTEEYAGGPEVVEIRGDDQVHHADRGEQFVVGQEAFDDVEA